MKKTSVLSFTCAFLIFTGLTAGLGVGANAYEEPEKFTVSAMTPEQQVFSAKHKIALIQTDPGYYYAGAAGATHRVHDVKEQEQVIAQFDRLPASVK